MGMVTARALFWSNKPNPAIPRIHGKEATYGWVGPILPEKYTHPSVEGLTPISL
jgi:hypothetical protein